MPRDFRPDISPDDVDTDNADDMSAAPKDTDPHLVREDEGEAVTHPLNPDPERRSQRKAQRDERPGS